MSRTGNEKIGEVVELYRRLELSAMFYELEYYNFKIVKRYKKSKKAYINDESIRQSIENSKKKVNEFYGKSKENHEISEFLGLTSMMFWCAFKRFMPVEHPQYDASKDIIEIVTKPLIEKINGLKIPKIT